MDAARRHETPGSETSNSLIHGKRLAELHAGFCRFPMSSITPMRPGQGSRMHADACSGAALLEKNKHRMWGFMTHTVSRNKSAPCLWGDTTLSLRTVLQKYLAWIKLSCAWNSWPTTQADSGSHRVRADWFFLQIWRVFQWVGNQIKHCLVCFFFNSCKT